MIETVLKEMAMDGYDAVFALWQRTDGVGLSDAGARENIDNFLMRNPGFSFVARPAKSPTHSPPANASCRCALPARTASGYCSSCSYL